MGEVKSPSVESLLIEFAKNGDVDRLNSLLYRHSDSPTFNINAKELFTGNTALIWAAKRGHGAVIQLLLKYNCDATLMNNDMQSALDVSPSAIRKVLMENGMKTSPFSYQLLHQACWQGSSTTVRRLLSIAPKPINVYVTNIEGYTALQLATRDLLLFEKLSSQMKISYEPSQTILELLTYGYQASDIGKIPNKRTPLHLACSSSAKISENVVKLLLSSGADVSLVDIYNFTPLHCAAFCGNCQTIDMLIKKNANVNAMASKGSTPLHLSAMAGMEAAVDLLLKNGADPSIKDNDQETPIETSKTRRIKYILEGKATPICNTANRTNNSFKRPTNLTIVKQPISRNKSCASLLEIKNNLERQKTNFNEHIMNTVNKIAPTSSIPVGKHGRVELHFVKNFRETSNLDLSHSANGGAKTSRPISSSRYQWRSSPNVSIFSPNTSLNRGFLPNISSSTSRITSSSSLSTERSQSGNFRVRKQNLSSQLSIQDDNVFIGSSEDFTNQGRTSSKTYIEDIEDMDSGVIRLGSGSNPHINDDLNTIHEASEETASIRDSTLDLADRKLILSSTSLVPNVPSVAEELNNNGSLETTEDQVMNDTSKGENELNKNLCSSETLHNKSETLNGSKTPSIISKPNNRAIRKNKGTKEEYKTRTVNTKPLLTKPLPKTPTNKVLSPNDKNKITVLKDLDKIDDKPEDPTSEPEIQDNNTANEQKTKPTPNKILAANKRKVKTTDCRKTNSSITKTNSNGKTKTNKNSSNIVSSIVVKPKSQNQNNNSNQRKQLDEESKESAASPSTKSSQKSLLVPVTKRSSIPNSLSENSNQADTPGGNHRLSIPNSFVASKNNSSSTSPMMHSPPPIASACLQPTAVISGIGWQVSTQINTNIQTEQITKEFSFAKTMGNNFSNEEEVLSEIESVNYEDDFDLDDEDNENEELVNNELKKRKSSPTLADITTRSQFQEDNPEQEALTALESKESSNSSHLNDDVNLTYTLKTPRTVDMSAGESCLIHNEYDNNSARSTISVDSNHGFRGSMIPNWRRGKLLGTGSFGKVWCILTEHGEQLAVKEIHYDSTHEAKCEAQNIQEEIEILKTVKHRNIVRFYGTSSDEGVVYIFMEYVPGGSLANALMQFGAFAESVFRRYTKQLVEGVSFLHSNNVMHRDIKGANIMLMPSGTIKLIDFGCAKRLQKHLSISNTGSRQNSLIGSPYWMAPEVIMETGHGRKSDVWSIGCTVFEMATGKPPWGDMPKMAAIFAIGSGDAEQPSLSESKFSSSACDFVKSCMTRDVTSRPTASDLLQHPFLTSNRSSSVSRTRELTMMKTFF